MNKNFKLNIFVLTIVGISALVINFGLSVLIPVGIISGLIYLAYWFNKNGKTAKKGDRYSHRAAVCNSAYRRAHKLKGDCDD